MGLALKTTKKDVAAYTIELHGSLDTESYSILENEISGLMNTQLQSLILDMQGLSYISSMGLSVILKTKQSLEKNKKIFIMVNLAPQIKKVFEIVSCLPGLRLFSSIQEADEYLSKIQRNEIDHRQAF